MQKQANLPIIIGAIVALLAVVGLIAFFTFGASHQKITQKEEKVHEQMMQDPILQGKGDSGQGK